MKGSTNISSLLLVLLVGFFSKSVVGQVVKDTNEILTEITSIISAMPGDSGDDYAIPNAVQLGSWGQALKDMLEGNYDEAADTANTLDYDLVQFLDTTDTPNRTYYILKSTGTNYWGTYVYNPSYCRTVVVQSPHPKKDFNTGKEGIHVFHESEAFFFMLSGTSRCNNAAFSTCDGTSSVCTGSSESYRISDLAHNIASVFQNTTDTLFGKYNNTYFLQLHGFGKLTSDPFIILSNGTQSTPTTDYIATFKTNLESKDALFVDSIKVAHVDLSWTRLRGFGNTQGRLINSSTDQCNADATATNGRFIHMEQEKTTLRDDVTGWTKVSEALTSTFSCMALPITLIAFDVHENGENEVVCEWSTSSEINNDFFTIERSVNGNDWQEVTNVNGAGNSTELKKYNSIDESPYLGVSYYRLKQTDFDGNSSFSYIRKVIVHNAQGIIVSIYPIPTSKLITVSADESELATYSIYNVVGEDVTHLVNELENTNGKLIIDLLQLKRGIYHLKTKTSLNKLYKL